MKTLCSLTTFVAFVTAVPSLAICGPICIRHSGSISDNAARKGELCVLDGEIRFVTFSENRDVPVAPDAPPLPDFSRYFVRDGQMLRVKIVPLHGDADNEGDFSEKLLAKDGWYVTADFSTDPPQVVLTLHFRS